jgi:predicted dehydrogenase
MTTKTKPVDIAVVGLGHLHPRLYMPLFASLPETQVTAVVEADADLRRAFAADFKVQAYSNVAALLKEQRPEAAFVFLPHADCPAAAEALARAGVHLFVEKPMAASAAGAERIERAARKARVRLATGYCWRLHPAAREIKSLVASGVLGDIVGGEGRIAAGRLQRYLDGHSPWMLDRKRSGGGPMYNLGVHWIDLLRWMLNDEVAEVSGRNVQVNTRYDIEDNSFAHLRFRKGAVVALDISYTVPDAFPYGRDLYLSLRGTRGVVSWAPAYEGEKDVVFVVSDDPRFAGSPKRHLQFDLEPVKGYSGYMGREIIRAFVQAIRKGGEPPVTGRDGVAALKVVEAVYRSAERKRWVEVPR